jgi:hypothetical protein
MRTRYCPVCEDEFRPDILRCSDCGGELVDRDDAEGVTDLGEPETGEPAPEPEPPASALRSVFTCIDSTSLKEAAALLGDAGIPFRATGDATGFRVLVLPAYQSDALTALAVLHGPVGDDTATAGDPGPAPHGEAIACPACGAEVPASASECAECGLVLGAEGPRCSACGSPLGPADASCAACGVASG